MLARIRSSSVSRSSLHRVDRPVPAQMPLLETIGRMAGEQVEIVGAVSTHSSVIPASHSTTAGSSRPLPSFQIMQRTLARPTRSLWKPSRIRPESAPAPPHSHSSVRATSFRQSRSSPYLSQQTPCIHSPLSASSTLEARTCNGGCCAAPARHSCVLISLVHSSPPALLPPRLAKASTQGEALVAEKKRMEGRPSAFCLPIAVLPSADVGSSVQNHGGFVVFS